MLTAPAALNVVVQSAVTEFPEPESATVAHPLIVFPFAVKATWPVGFEPLTVAVKVTSPLFLDGLSELLRVVLAWTTLPALTETASRKVVLSLASVPVNPIVCAPLEATLNTMLKVAKAVLAGETSPPICAPSTVTMIGWMCGDTQQA